MTRDMDFRRQKTSTPAINPIKLQLVVKEPPLESPRGDPPSTVSSGRSNRELVEGPQNKSKNWLLIVLLLGLILAAGGIYWKFVSENETESLNKAGNPTELNGSAADQAKTKTAIWVYRDGAKTDPSDQLIQKLRRLGYNAVDSGASQFSYTETQIWYTTGHLSDAQTVSALIGTESAIEQTPMGGSFDVLVYLTK